MVASGMRDAGYRYVVIDDCWQGERDADGFIQPDPERFPSGMKALADYVHAKGLKLGLYSDAGWRPAATGRAAAATSSRTPSPTRAGGSTTSSTTGATPRASTPRAPTRRWRQPSTPPAGRSSSASASGATTSRGRGARTIGHLWRTTGDIAPCFDCEVDHGDWSSWGVLRILDMQEGLRVHAGPGHWNDPDMMEVGNGMSEAEDRAHFSMWACSRRR